MKPYTITKKEGTYFCTDTFISFADLFTNRRFFNIIIDSFKYCQKNKGLQLHAYVIMPSHVHYMVSALNGDLSGIIRDYKQFTSRQIIKVLKDSHYKHRLDLFKSAAQLAGKGNEYKVWQTGSHPQIMDDEKKCIQKLEYIHNNSVKKGYVEQPEHWIYSSARNYKLNDNTIIKIQKLW